MQSDPLKRLLPLTLLITLLLVTPVTATPATDAAQALSTAETASLNAFQAIRSAQLAGANVTTLTGQFNQALTRLQAAEQANATANYSYAVQQSQAATQTFNYLQVAARSLQTQAESDTTLRSILIILTSILAVALVTAGFYFTERWQHKRWLKRLPEMRIRLREEEDEDT